MANLAGMDGSVPAWDLRPATIADHPLARAMHHAAYRDVVDRQFGSWDEARQDAFFDAGWAAEHVSIIRSGGADIGYLRIERGSEAVDLMEIVIHPAHHSRGIGTAILSMEIQAARSRGVPVRLRVLQANHARKLYARLGFREYGRTPTHILMALR